MIEELFRRYAITSIPTTLWVRSRRLLLFRGLTRFTASAGDRSLTHIERIKRRARASATRTTSKRHAWVITSSIFPTCRNLQPLRELSNHGRPGRHSGRARDSGARPAQASSHLVSAAGKDFELA